MIVFLRGTVQGTGGGYVDLDVQGVGYRTWVTDGLSASVTPGETLFLYTHQHIREDVSELFGFTSEADRTWFELLLSVSGVGPKGALQILSATVFDTFATAVSSEDVDALCRLPGIGKKTAQRLIVELKDKVAAMWVPQWSRPADQMAARPSHRKGDNLRLNALQTDLLEALLALGYPEREAMLVVAEVTEDAADHTLEDALRLALAQLGRGNSMKRTARV